MIGQNKHIKKSKVNKSENGDSKDEVRLQIITEEDVRCMERSRRGRSHSEAGIDASYNSVLLSSARQSFKDNVDSKLFGLLLPKIYKLNNKLIEAIKCKDNIEVQRLLHQGANPNSTCPSDYVSACHLAAFAGGDALSLLQARNAQLMTTDRIGRTPLHLAAWAGNIEQVAILLNIPTYIRSQIKDEISDKTAEYITSTNSHFKELANVRCTFCETTKQSNDWKNIIHNNYSRASANLPLMHPGWTPLHAASANAQHQCVRLLLAAGSDATLEDYVGRSPLNVAGFAHYSGKQINANDFAKVIELLLQANPNNYIKQTKTPTTPLHTAVQLESIEAINKLLAAGASALTFNRDGLSPLYLCVKKKLKEALMILLKNNNNKEKNVLANIDKKGNTVLHTAVLSNWSAGVCIALEAGADILAKTSNGDTVIHLAAELGNVEIINEILSSVDIIDIKRIVNYQNIASETALYKAVENGHIECVKKLLDEGASIAATKLTQFSVLHLAAKLGFAEILKVLLNHNNATTKSMINVTVEDEKGYGPIHFAVSNNHPDCVKALLIKNANVRLRTLGADKVQSAMSTPLHIAAETNNLEIAKILCRFDAEVHDVDNYNWTPLHSASSCKSRDVILLLLNEGADLSAVTSGPLNIRKTAVDMIMNNFSKPTDIMEELFDTFIYSNDLNVHDPNFEVTIDYSILNPKNDNTQINTKGVGQITVIDAIIGTGNRHQQDRLLLHPLILSFIYLKWKALLPFFCVILALYTAFVVSFTTFILTLFYFEDMSKDTPPTRIPKIWASISIATLMILVTQETLYYKFSQRYHLKLETWIKLITISLAFILLTLYLINSQAQEHVWYRNVATVALLVSWVEFTFLLSGYPKLGYYVPMFRKVSSNVLQIFMTFLFLIIGFSLSFMVQFHGKEPFDGPFAAIFKTMVMMTSEFDYDDLIKNSKNITELNKTSTEVTPYVVHIVFIVFLLFIAVVLMNLMVGVAVHDLQNLEFIGNIRSIKKQVEFLYFLDNLINNCPLFNKMPLAHILKKTNIEKKISFRPCEQSCRYYKELSVHLRDAIFERAQTQKELTDEELYKQSYKIKLDDLYKNIVNRNNNTLPDELKVRSEKDEDKNDQTLQSVVADLKNELRKTQFCIELINLKTNSILRKLNKCK